MGTQKDNSVPAISEGGPVPLREPIAYKGVRVLTTELAARAFGATVKQLSDNYGNHAGRFVEGKHFYKVDGAELRALKDKPDFIGLVAPQARHLILWTERGIARHAKILDTDTAWEIFEQLEDTYFRVKAATSAPVTPQIRRASASELRLSHAYWLKIAREAGLDANQALISTNRFVRRLTGVDALQEMEIKALEAPTTETMLIPKEIGERLGGLSSQLINKRLTTEGFHSPYRTASGRLEYELTDKGKEIGGRKFDTERRHADGTIVPQIKWPASIVDKLH